jgi:nucleotide-binding universal stress UspA family protein
MHGRLVVGFDGSQSSASALRWAMAEAQVRNASVSVVCSYWMPPLMDAYGLGLHGGPSDAEVAQATMEEVRDAVAGVSAEHPGVAVQQFVIDEPPVDALVRRAADGDLLVIGSNGMGVRRGLL